MKPHLDAIAAIKHENKRLLASRLYKMLGVELDPKAMFIAQIKRIHEYKRQLLNALHIVVLYQRLRENPSLPVPPRTFFFAGKENKPDGAARLHAGSFDRPQRIDDHCGVAAVIERAGAQFPGIQMSSEDHEFVGLLAAFDFSNNICGLDGATDAIGNAEVCPHGMAGGQ